MTAVWFLVAIAVCSDGGSEMFAPLLLLLVGGTLAAAWILRPIVAIAIRASAGQKPTPLSGDWTERTPRPSPGDWLAWLSFPIALTLAVFLRGDNRGLKARIALSESSLRGFARGIGPGRSVDYGPSRHRVGLFWIRKVQEQQRCVSMTIGDSVMDEDGLAYFPGPETPYGDSDWHFHHISGPWWYFTHNTFHPWGH